MTADPRQFIVRRPRHDVNPNASCRVWLEFPECDQPPVRDGKLVDLSRQGAQVQIAQSLNPEEVVILRIQDDSYLDATIRGTVRWQRPAGPDHWAIGCIFDEELSYELMGEFFLSGILDMGCSDC